MSTTETLPTETPAPKVLASFMLGKFYSEITEGEFESFTLRSAEPVGDDLDMVSRSTVHYSTIERAHREFKNVVTSILGKAEVIAATPEAE